MSFKVAGRGGGCRQVHCTFFWTFQTVVEAVLNGQKYPWNARKCFLLFEERMFALCHSFSTIYIYMTDVPGWHLFLFLFLFLLLLLLLLLLAVCYIEWNLLMGQLAKDLSETWKKWLSSHKFWENYSDLGWSCPKMWFSKGIPPKFLPWFRCSDWL